MRSHDRTALSHLQLQNTLGFFVVCKNTYRQPLHTATRHLTSPSDPYGPEHNRHAEEEGPTNLQHNGRLRNTIYHRLYNHDQFQISVTPRKSKAPTLDNL